MKRQAGFSFVELIISIAVFAIAITAILGVFIGTTSKSADPMVQAQAAAIAQSYMEEILLREFSDPDGVSGEGRATADDVDDYDGLVDNGARDQFNNPIAGLEDYTVTVSVNASSDLGVGGGDEKRIDVTVTHPIGISLRFSGYKTNPP